MPSPQHTGKQRLLALAAGHPPRTHKPAQDLRTHGGKVKGPGTPTSDSIDAKLSKGEFVLPADTTRKVGLRRLMKLVDATHKPTGKPKKPGHYADGGLAEDEEEQRAAAARQPAAPTPARVQTPSPTAMFVEDSAQEAGRRWDQGDVAGAIGAGARTAVGGVGMAAIEALDNTVGAASRGFMDGAKKFAAGFTGSDAKAAEVDKPAPASAATSEAASTVAPDAPADQSSTVTPLGESEAAKTSAPAATQVAPGVYSHGKGQFSDRAGGMGFSDGFTGQPTAENDKLMQGLADQSTPGAASASNVTASPLPSAVAANTATSGQVVGATGESTASPQATTAKPRESWSTFASRMMDLERGTAGTGAGTQTPQMRSPTAVHSGNDWNVRQALRKAEMDAKSIIHQSRWAPKGSGQAAQKAYAEMRQADIDAMTGQSAMDAEAMKANAALLRESMGQQGASSRAAIQEAGANRREGLRSLGDMAKFDQDSQEQSLRMRGMQRLDQAQEELLKAQTPAQVSSARARLLALHGKSGQEQTKWRSGNDRDGNPFLYNEATAETRPMNAPAARQAPAEGSTHRGSDGRQYVIRNGQYVPVESSQ